MTMWRWARRQTARWHSTGFPCLAKIPWTLCDSRHVSPSSLYVAHQTNRLGEQPDVAYAYYYEETNHNLGFPLSQESSPQDEDLSLPAETPVPSDSPQDQDPSPLNETMHLDRRMISTPPEKRPIMRFPRCPYPGVVCGSASVARVSSTMLPTRTSTYTTTMWPRRWIPMSTCWARIAFGRIIRYVVPPASRSVGSPLHYRSSRAETSSTWTRSTASDL